MTKQKVYKIGDRVKFKDKGGIERVGVVYEAGALYCRVETYIGIGKLRDLSPDDFTPATELDFFQYVEKMRADQTTKVIMAALDPAVIIEREKKEYPEEVVGK